MAYFIPSYLQKRLLRYALSRLEILDTDALDLSSLDIAWGSRSTVELRDIGLRNNKIGPLLQLPSHIGIESTSVALVRLTVPADLYTSPIIIDIEQVTAEAKLTSSSSRETPATKSTQPPTSPGSRPKGDLSEESGELPDAQHLAQSFLEQERDSEREELEAIVAAQSVDLQQSVSSDSTGDEETNAGTGVGLSLPAFLASFLKGIGDRLQVNINDVSLTLLIDAADDDPSRPTAVSLKIDRVHVYEATSSKSPQEASVASDNRNASTTHVGRLIKLSNARASIRTDAASLEGNSRAADRTQSGKESQSPTQTWSPSAISRSGTENSEGPASLTSSARPHGARLPHPLAPDRSVDSLGSRFADADDNVAQSTFFESEAGSSDYVKGNNTSTRPFTGSLNTLEDLSKHLHHSLESFREEKQHSSSYIAEQRRSDRYSPVSTYSSRASSSGQQTPTRKLHDESVFEYAHESMSDADRNTHDSLTESRVFSHADAESIYMSIADTTPIENTERFPLPGAWDDTSTYSRRETRIKHPTETQLTGVTESLPTGDLLLGVENPLHLPAADNSVIEDRTSAKLQRSDNKFHSTTMQNPNMIEIQLFMLDKAEVLISDSASETADDTNATPTAHAHGASDPMSVSASMSMSSFNDMPGAFSSYADITSRKRGIGPRTRHLDSQLVSASESKRSSTNDSGPAIDVTLGKINLQINISAVPFFIRFSRKLQGVLSSQIAEKEKSSKEAGRDTQTSPALPNLTIQALALDIFGDDSVETSPEDPTRSRVNTDHHGHTNRPSSIFALNLGNIGLRFSDFAGPGSCEFTIHCITCDGAGKRLFSFDREATLGSSMRGAHAPDKDLSVTYSQTRGSPEISVVTLPIIFDLDFYKVDETLSSFGGFSGLIELGSSILSDPESLSSAMPPPERPRAVRFESGLNPPRSDIHTGTLRINVRINGGLVTLKGLESTIRCRSSAIKLVRRESGIGLQIDELALDAPYTEHRTSSLQLKLQNFGLKYLAHPEEHDLSRLISLLTPSKDKFEEADDFLLDTLLRQRKKGAAMRLNIGVADLVCSDLASIQKMQNFVSELTKLSVAKYLPEESPPGMLTLALISKTQVRIDGVPKLGNLHLDLLSAELGHIGAPSLVAVGIQSLSLKRDHDESILKEVFPSSDPTQPPMVMARFIGDEMEPTIKVKLWNIVFEYSVPLAETLLGLGNTDPSVNVAADLTASLANLTDRQPAAAVSPIEYSSPSGSSASQTKPKLDLSLRDCALALNPHKLPSRALLVLTQARLDCAFPVRDDLHAYLDIRKASLLLIDDIEKLLSPDSVHQEAAGIRLARRDQLSDLSRQGYVSMSWISAATVNIRLTRSNGSEPDVLDLGIGDELLVIEACADSTATLGDLFGALTPKLPPPKGDRYRTEVASMQDMMASFTGDAFAVKPEDSRVSFEDAHDVVNFLDDATSSDFDAYDQFPDLEEDEPFVPENEDDIYQFGQESTSTAQPQQSQASMIEDPGRSDLETISGGVHLTRMDPQISPFAKKWDSTNNRYLHLSPSELAQSPIRVHVRDVHVIWNLYDGYDWEKTRNVITKAVQEVQTKAEERRLMRRTSREAIEEEEESVIGDFLFNSIYIGIPANHDPKELTQQINRDVDDMMTETGSHTSTTVTSRPGGSNRPLRQHGKKLRLQRSRRHKIAFELRGLSADYFAFPPSGETQSSLDVRIKDFEIYDHVPTSTWKKFLTYMHDAGPREDKKPMIHLEICDVRPVPELIASELVLRATVLPVRLHVDQDALDFMTRFFAFNESTSSDLGTSPAPPSASQPYLQRVEVYPVPLKLDYKPKRVDYAGIRSGRTNEFKNFFVLDGAEMVLKHAIIYGTSGFDKLHHSLEDVWTPDIIRNQLPSVLSGLGGVRTLVNVGAGMRDLVVVPVREYQKDGRIVRSISKGAMAFARSTGGEITRFGAKLAVGAQTALQGAEDFLTAPPASTSAVDRDWEEADLDESEKRAISHYADQPAGFFQGLRGAARSLERDLLLTRDVIVAISGEIRESDTAGGAARVLARHAPTLVLRPMIGASKAIGQTLMGANNSVDPANRRRVEDKYKRY